MTNAEKRELRVWAFGMVLHRQRTIFDMNIGANVVQDRAPPILELIGEADTLVQWATAGEVKL